MTEQKPFVTGYQYSPQSGKLIGEYVFPNNLDRLAIHLPPYTTLEAPPEAEGQDAYWIGDAWELREEVTRFDEVPVPDIRYEDLLPEFIAALKASGAHATYVKKLYDKGLVDTTDEAELAAKIERGNMARRFDADMIDAYAENLERARGY